MKKYLSKKLVTILLLTSAATVVTNSTQAHHSFAMYDKNKSYVITGVVTGINPDSNHMQLFYAHMNDERDGVVRDEDGEPVIWSIEMLGSAMAARIGITVASFPPGTIFSAAFHPTRVAEDLGGVQIRERNQSVIFKCPNRDTPEPGMHCDSVEGSTTHGNGESLPEPTGPVPSS